MCVCVCVREREREREYRALAAQVVCYAELLAGVVERVAVALT